MRRNCNDYLEGLADLAEGKANTAAAAHAESCKDCRELLAQLKALVRAACTPMDDAPAEVVARAAAIMPAHARPNPIKLFSSSLATSMARRSSSDFQAVVGDDETRVRLMFTKTQKGWKIMGRVPSPEWRIRRGQTEIPSDPQGGFSFEVSSLTESDFLITNGAQELYVPPIEDLIDGSDAAP